MRASTPELLDELSKFGGLLLNEVYARTTSIDSKASNIVGWTPIVLTGLLAIGASTVFQKSGIGLLGAACLASGALLFGYLALRVRDWQWPSEDDWFQSQLFENPSKLRIFHLLGMLETHQRHNRLNFKKGQYLQWSQLMLCGSGLVIATMSIPDTWWSWFYSFFK